MSYNQSFYNNFSGNFTFQGGNRPPCYIPPPPMPPPYFLTPLPNPEHSDQELLKTFESNIVRKPKVKAKQASITEVRQQLQKLITALQDIKIYEYKLKHELEALPDDQWCTEMNEIECRKAEVNELMKKINNSHLENLRKLLAKRSAKRLRLKRLHIQQKLEKVDRNRKLQERSRKIDDNLQKIKDDIDKAKQEEEAKLHSDMVLKEVSKKKHDAKKSLSKLDALMKLHKARVNTAKGIGMTIPESELDTFSRKIDDLKSLWVCKLASYEMEELELLNKLNQDKDETTSGAGIKEKEVEKNLSKWRKVIFGGKNAIPQADFNGDFNRFIAVRSHWDQYIHNDGTALPVGWVFQKGSK